MRHQSCGVYVLGQILLGAWKDFATRAKKTNASKGKQTENLFGR
jgi:hypothetical protein